MKTSIRVTVHSPTKGTHEEEFNIIQFPSGEIGGHFSPEFVDFTAYAASSINNVIMIVKVMIKIHCLLWHLLKRRWTT